MNSPSAALIVLNYHDVDRSLSVAESGIKTGLFQKIFLVDNASDEASIAKIHKFQGRYPLVSCPIFSPKNLGWCAGTNLGLKQALSTNAFQYLFAVNSDVAFSRESIAECLSFLESSPRYGAVAPLMKDSGGNLDYNWGLIPGFKDTLNSIFFFGERKFRKKEFANAPLVFSGSNPDVQWIRGSFIAFRSDALKQTQLFDERFFLYCGEYSLFIQLRDKGWKSAVIHSASYQHNHIYRESFKSLRWKKKSNLKSTLLYLRYYQHISWLKRAYFWLASRLALLEYDLIYLRLSLKQRKTR